MAYAVEASQASAQPNFRLSATGRCPSRAVLESALANKGWNLAAGDSNTWYWIASRAERAGAQLSLRRQDGTTLLQRRISSLDCRALADAMLDVVEAYFIDMGELTSPTPPLSPAPTHDAPAAQPNDASDRPSPNAANVAEPVPAPVPVGPAPRSNSPAERESTPHANSSPPQGPSNGLNSVLTTNDPTSANRPQPLVPAPPGSSATPGKAKSINLVGKLELRNSPSVAREINWRGFVGIGTLLSLPTEPLTFRVELGAGAEWGVGSMASDISLATSLPTNSSDNRDRIRRWANQGLWRVSWMTPPSIPARPWAGLGLNVATLTAPDLPSRATRMTYSPLVGVGLEGTWPIGSSWQSRLDLGCLVLARRDHYTVATTESIGDGPRFACHASLGLVLASRRGN